MTRHQVLIPSVTGSNLTEAIPWELECSEVCGGYEPTLQVYFKLNIANHTKVTRYGQGKLTGSSSNFIYRPFFILPQSHFFLNESSMR